MMTDFVILIEKGREIYSDIRHQSIELETQYLNLEAWKSSNHTPYKISVQ